MPPGKYVLLTVCQCSISLSERPLEWPLRFEKCSNQCSFKVEQCRILAHWPTMQKIWSCDLRDSEVQYDVIGFLSVRICQSWGVHLVCDHHFGVWEIFRQILYLPTREQGSRININIPLLRGVGWLVDLFWSYLYVHIIYSQAKVYKSIISICTRLICSRFMQNVCRA